MAPQKKRRKTRRGVASLMMMLNTDDDNNETNSSSQSSHFATADCANVGRKIYENNTPPQIEPAKPSALFKFTENTTTVRINNTYSKSEFYNHSKKLINNNTNNIHNFNNFLKGLSFSPDGTCILSASEDHILRVYEVPSDVWTYGDDDSNTNSRKNNDKTINDLSSVISSQEGGCIYDYSWYVK